MLQDAPTESAEGLPDISWSDKRFWSAKFWASLPGRILIEDKLRRKLQIYRWRTGLSAERLLLNAQNVPEGLRANIIGSWLRPEEKKQTKTAEKNFLQFVTQEYEKHFASNRLLGYLRQGVSELLERGAFDGDQEFRLTQGQALKAYHDYLFSDDLTDEEKLQGFFEMPTGVGKTAVFVGIIAAAQAAAEQEADSLNTVVVVPTTQLLYQTQSAFADFAPQLADKIGLYGDGHKDLDHPITIMTYDAWYDLSQSGKIGSHNVHILVSDEAHRGTSERRIENLAGIFNAKTVQIAFTATAHFDETKSVEATHKRQIFYKPIKDGVLEDELSSYVQSQRAVIRVEPTAFMLSDEFAQADIQTQIKYRQNLRQKTWNKFALKVFRDGVDEHTQEPLSDNQAGFFVEGINQANNLEKMLNADPVLKAKARAQGRKGVAVAIHSGISPKEQRRRFDDYKAGKYMAVIGDEKFKEGFDHPPLKTVIDCPHASVVDKGQIVGRGTRKWWNELKGRWEGLTVIDTVIYLGSTDKEQDALERDRALRHSISVKDILEDSYVLGPKAPPAKPASGKTSGEDTNPFADEPNVEYYSKIEEIYHLNSEISRINREHVIPITDEMRRELNDEAERTCMGFIALMKIEGAPQGLTAGKIESWRQGIVRTVDPEEWNWVLAIYEEQPTRIEIQINDQMRRKLKEEIERTGIGCVRLLSLKSPPKDLNARKIESWRNGSSSTALQEEWDWVIATYKEQKTQKEISITSKMRQELNDEVERTGIGSRNLLQIKGAPKDIPHWQISLWRSGKIKTTLKQKWDQVLAVYKAQPSITEILITDQMRQELNDEVKRIGIGSVNLVQLKGMPKDIKHATISVWRSGKRKTALKQKWDQVLAVCKAQPSITEIQITDQMCQQLNDEVKRTGVGSKNLLKLKKVPERLSHTKIDTWRNGSVKSAIKNEWDWVMKAYKSLPDAGQTAKPAKRKGPGPS